MDRSKSRGRGRPVPTESQAQGSQGRGRGTQGGRGAQPGGGGQWGNAGGGRGGGGAGGPSRGAGPMGVSAPSAGGRGGQPSGGGRGGQPSGSAWGNPNAPRDRATPSGGPPQAEAMRTIGASGAPQGVPRPTAPTPFTGSRPPAPSVEGRASLHREQASDSDVQSSDAIRGAMRGKRVINEIVRSRPANCVNKTGTVGKKIVLDTNYFRVQKTPKWTIYQYRVDIAPDTDMIRLRRAYLSSHKELFGGYIFDGTILFCTTNLLPQMQNGILELMTKNREGDSIQIKIKHVGVVDNTDAQQLQVLNLILRRAMAGLKLELVGRNFFDAKAKINMENFRMEIWPGYTTSIRQHDEDILLCTEIAHKVMRTDTLYHILNQCLRESDDYQSAFRREAVGMVVLTDYNNKTYRIDDVDFSLTPKSTFPTKDGELSFVDYYKKKYNINIKDTNQPMLLSRPTEKNLRAGENQVILLIPELARATGMTDAMRNNFRLMKAMGDQTRLNPERRIDRLRRFNQRLQQSKESVEVLTSWNMKLDTELVQVTGRILNTERIFFGNQRQYRCDDRVDWSREFRNGPMYSQKDITRWIVIVPRRNVRAGQDFAQMCAKVAAGMKMNIASPMYEEIPDDRTGSYSKAIDTAVARDPQIVMIVLANDNEEKYSCVKKKCCVDRPVASQVVTLRTISPREDKKGGLMSIATKVVIQMNAKLGGAPWMFDLPLKGLMTIGFDVSHSAKEKNKSFGALVASMDLKSKCQYYSTVTPHQKGQEISNEITFNVTCALKQYREVHGCLPERILFYRDGVGDGQLDQVVSSEITCLMSKMNEIYKAAGHEAGCKMIFIVVAKRINTRYFASGQNPVPGTVVDSVITLPERYDFFLVSQSVRQGTVSPTSYNIIYDTFGLDPDKIQMLTYKNTHMYYNWAGTCRVPAVCQYAHKLSFMVAESIGRAPNNLLESQLYFL